MARSRRRRSSSAPSAQIVRYAPAPAQRPIVINTTGGNAPARRRGGGRIARRSNPLTSLLRGRSGSGDLIPLRQMAEGGGGGVLSGIIDDLVPNILVGSKWGRFAVVLGGGIMLARVTGMPSNVVSGIAGGASRKLYDQLTTT